MVISKCSHFVEITIAVEVVMDVVEDTPSLRFLRKMVLHKREYLIMEATWCFPLDTLRKPQAVEQEIQSDRPVIVTHR
jgi:hypothetical protein